MPLFGRGKDEAKPLLVIDDKKNRVELWPTKITLSRHGFLNAVNIGQTGVKDIYLTSITGIQVKKPGWTVGYIQFLSQGTGDNKGGVTGAVQDENSVVFGGKKNYKIAQEMKAKIEELRHQPLTVAGPPLSTADEIAKLASLRDQGLLSDKEFEEEKKVLLKGGK